MRVRTVDASGDMTFGGGQDTLLADSPEAVVQLVQSRLRLEVGEWFFNTAEGTAWQSLVLGKYTALTRDAELRRRIITTPGVRALVAYSSRLNRRTRRLVIAAEIDTLYGPARISETL